MKKFATALAAILFTLNAQAADPAFWLGADISGTTHDESRGHFSYNRDGVQTENTALMKELGLNATRLRVWVDPRGGWSGASDVLEMARRSQRLGMDIMVDFHYSDWWADPGKQTIPRAWADTPYPAMCDSVAAHTRSVLQLLRDNGIDVRWVQVGNETRHGFLWPTGRIEDNMAQYAGLTNAGYDAVKSVYPDADVIVHIDNGFDQQLFDRIFDSLKAHGGRWDVIGMSLYPYWAIDGGYEPDAQSTLDHGIANLRHLGEKYGCDVMVVETGVDARDPVPGEAFMTQLIERAVNETGGRCKGVFYWAPETNPTGYFLGAFQDSRPTVIMDAFTKASRKYGLSR